MILHVLRISGIVGEVSRFSVVCGVKVDNLCSLGGWKSMEGGGSKSWFTDNSRCGDKWPGVFLLKTMSLEK
jgi:hypothetical protein